MVELKTIEIEGKLERQSKETRDRDNNRGERNKQIAVKGAVTVRINGKQFNVSPKAKAALASFYQLHQNKKVGSFVAVIAAIFGLEGLLNSPPEIFATLVTDTDSLEAQLTAPQTWDAAMNAQLRDFVKAQLLDAHLTNDVGAQRMWQHVRQIIQSPDKVDGGVVYNFRTKELTLPPLPGEWFSNHPSKVYSLKQGDYEELETLRDIINNGKNPDAFYYLTLTDFMASMKLSSTPGTITINGRDRALLNKALLCVSDFHYKIFKYRWVNLAFDRDKTYSESFWIEMAHSLDRIRVPEIPGLTNAGDDSMFTLEDNGCREGVNYQTVKRSYR